MSPDISCKSLKFSKKKKKKIIECGLLQILLGTLLNIMYSVS